MKKINDILGTISDDEIFKKLKKSEMCNKVVSLLTPNLKAGIKYAYLKNNTLNFVLTHNMFVREFELKKNTIYSIVKLCEFENEIINLRFTVDYSINKNKKIELQNKKNQTYKERSFGIFDNKLTDDSLRKIFENIRTIIKNIKENEND